MLGGAGAEVRERAALWRHVVAAHGLGPRLWELLAQGVAAAAIGGLLLAAGGGGVVLAAGVGAGVATQARRVALEADAAFAAGDAQAKVARAAHVRPHPRSLCRGLGDPIRLAQLGAWLAPCWLVLAPSALYAVLDVYRPAAGLVAALGALQIWLVGAFVGWSAASPPPAGVVAAPSLPS